MESVAPHTRTSAPITWHGEVRLTVSEIEYPARWERVSLGEGVAASDPLSAVGAAALQCSRRVLRRLYNPALPWDRAPDAAAAPFSSGQLEIMPCSRGLNSETMWNTVPLRITGRLVLNSECARRNAGESVFREKG